MKTTTLVALLGLTLGGCASEYAPMEGVAVVSSINLEGQVAEIAASIPKAQLKLFVQEGRNGVAYADCDDEVKEQTFFRHIGMEYKADGDRHGHGPPGVNDTTHIDLQFYGIDQATREAITCQGEPMPEDNRVPAGVEVNVNAEPFGGCVKAMGAHGGAPYDRLTANMSYGYSQGALIFVEPMIDIELITSEQRIDLDIALPEVVGRATRMATRFLTRHAGDRYVFVLTDFVDVQ
jgi:hypothetical protein